MASLSLYLPILFWACVMQDPAALKLTSVICRCEGNGTFFECATRKPASHSALLCERAARLKGHAASCLLVSRKNQSTTFDSGSNTPPEKEQCTRPPINVAPLARFASYFFLFCALKSNSHFHPLREIYQTVAGWKRSVAMNCASWSRCDRQGGEIIMEGWQGGREVMPSNPASR